MWKPKLETGTTRKGPARVAGGAMAHRRAVGGQKLAVGSVGLLLLAFLLAGSVYISNRVTGLRAEIAQLESQTEFLEAGSARLQSDWNKATAPAVIKDRAWQELGLFSPRNPDLVLVAQPVAGDKVSVWRRWLDNVGGADAAQAATVPGPSQGNMVSLSPRQVADWSRN